MKPHFTLDIDPRKLFFASDFHFFHNKEFIWKARGYESEEHHRFDILAKLKALPADGTLIYLGDFCLQTGRRQAEALLREIPCKIIYIYGNHENATDALVPEIAQWHGSFANAVINDHNIVLCHYPIISWPGAGRGAWHIHGHCHLACNIAGIKFGHPEETRFKSLDVGWDYKNDLWTLEQIESVIERKQNYIVEQHREII